MTTVFKKILYKLPLELRSEKIEISTHIDALLQIEQECFPEHMQDSRAEIMQYFSDPNAFGLILYEDDEPIGALKGTLISEQNSPGILEQYPELNQLRAKTFYADSISILEDYRTTHVLDFFIHEIAVYCRRAGYLKFTGHARIRRGYSRLLQRRYGAKKIASYQDWHDFGEPFDYILVDVLSFPTLPPTMYQVMRGVRFLYRYMMRIKYWIDDILGRE